MWINIFFDAAQVIEHKQRQDEFLQAEVSHCSEDRTQKLQSFINKKLFTKCGFSKQKKMVNLKTMLMICFEVHKPFVMHIWCPEVPRIWDTLKKNKKKTDAT